MVVLRAGQLTTVQDEGRTGWAHLGVPRAGHLDPPSAQLASPPQFWDEPFSVMAAELDLAARVLPDAHLLVAARYVAALTEGTTP